ncbi:MAG: T9SS type A sorting domain-containing protein [Bacteroidia bacterium]
MKKILLFLISAAPIAALAQITINQSDLPVANTLWVQATDTGYTGAIPAGGVSQSWNYATLQNNQQDSTSFVAAAGTPYAAQFPGSNLASPAGNAAYAYFTSNATGLSVNGIVDPASGTTIHYNPARLIIPVPFTYNSNIVNTARFQLDTNANGLNLRIVQITQQTFNGDGYGSLVLPNGNYPSTLRVKEVDLQTDSIYIDFGLGYTPLSTSVSQTSNLIWVRNGVGALLLQIGADSLAQQATGGASYFLSTGPTGIADIAPVDVKSVYPNPSSDFVTVDLSNLNGDAQTLLIYDITGRQVDAMNIQHIDRNTFDVRHYENGRYIMRIAGTDMQPVTGSFTVVH